MPFRGCTVKFAGGSAGGICLLNFCRFLYVFFLHFLRVLKDKRCLHFILLFYCCVFVLLFYCFFVFEVYARLLPPVVELSVQYRTVVRFVCVVSA